MLHALLLQGEGPGAFGSFYLTGNCCSLLGAAVLCLKELSGDFSELTHFLFSAHFFVVILHSLLCLFPLLRFGVLTHDLWGFVHPLLGGEGLQGHTAPFRSDLSSCALTALLEGISHNSH